MPNASLFSSQARFVQNNVTVETTNHLYEQTQLQQLLTTNEAGTKTLSRTVEYRYRNLHLSTI